MEISHLTDLPYFVHFQFLNSTSKMSTRGVYKGGGGVICFQYRLHQIRVE